VKGLKTLKSAAHPNRDRGQRTEATANCRGFSVGGAFRPCQALTSVRQDGGRLPCYTFFLFHLSCCLTEGCIDKRFIRTNDRIRAREIRVIDDEGQQIGILTPYDALKMAREKNLDLVEISPTATPPVCRIMDYGKFLYQQEKKEREAKKHQKVIVVKEVKFRINVDDHDYQTKKNHVLRFLDEGDKVKATIFFRGREMTRTNLGREILERLIKDIADKGIVEFRPRQEGNTLHAILAPKKDAGQKQPAQSQPAPGRVNQA
jgi:translation initiation factor IF-3